MEVAFVFEVVVTLPQVRPDICNYLGGKQCCIDKFVFYFIIYQRRPLSTCVHAEPLHTARITSPCTDSKTPAHLDSSDRKLIDNWNDPARTLDQQAPINNRVNVDSWMIFYVLYSLCSLTPLWCNSCVDSPFFCLSPALIPSMEVSLEECPRWWTKERNVQKMQLSLLGC